MLVCPPACQSLLREVWIYNAEMKAKIVKNAAINAGATALYIAAISLFLSHGSKFFDSDKGESAVIPAVMLCLFVFSAAITALLIFGRPVTWYLDGRKKEAFSLLAHTLGIFLGIIALLFLVLIFI